MGRRIEQSSSLETESGRLGDKPISVIIFILLFRERSGGIVAIFMHTFE
ncbi:hypothetical protein FOVG_13317 [Fusarium oxysporum f. sp. pisi HDV247]|uniref:Uncharacterized protein n=1 Tax=Fusarium oxysporum f. sp. pisi HDV247 TaxID=1080344 RepID=W9P1Z6_FUSOX|nr:hypothetical protein FOVG_13317 [Fusarium oxysporum f. sp. pisi HDV247]